MTVPRGAKARNMCASKKFPRLVLMLPGTKRLLLYSQYAIVDTANNNYAKNKETSRKTRRDWGNGGKIGEKGVRTKGT